MPRYFFHASGTVSFVDRDGQELLDDRAAWSLAVSSTGELIRDLHGKLPEQADIQTTVTNPAGAVLITLRFTAERHSAHGRARPFRPDAGCSVKPT